MNEVVPFRFEDNPVRVVHRDGAPWFVLADVCRILDLSNPSKAAASLDDDERHTLTNGEGIAAPQVQQVTVISESGLWSLILRSRKAEAKRFKKWVTAKVLPAIRQTGQYGSPAPAIDLSDPIVLQRLVHDLSGMAMDAGERIAQLEPKADALDRLTEARGSLCITDAAKALGVQPRRLFAWLEANRWIYRRSEAGHFVAFGPKLEAGLLEHKGTTIAVRGRPDKWVEQVLVTPKGLARLAHLKAGA